MGSGGTYANANFDDFQNASITGTKYTDLTGNGFSSDDTPQGGVTIDLYQGSSASGSPFETAVTAGNGTYSFANLTPGTYFVQETVPSGWTQTGGNAGYLVVVGPGGLGSGGTSTGDNFDDFQNVSLSGEVYNDLNGDGTIDPGDTGFSGWTVKLLNNSNQVIATTTTNSGGIYSFSGVGPDSKTIQEVPQTGPGNVPYVPTVPSTGTIAITPTSGTNRSGLNFGNILQPEVVDVRIDWGTQSMSLLNLNRDLPFVDINAIDIIFNENVSVTQGDLALSTLINSGKTYNFTGFSYNAVTLDAKWTAECHRGRQPDDGPRRPPVDLGHRRRPRPARHLPGRLHAGIQGPARRRQRRWRGQQPGHGYR